MILTLFATRQRQAVASVAGAQKLDIVLIRLVTSNSCNPDRHQSAESAAKDALMFL